MKLKICVSWEVCRNEQPRRRAAGYQTPGDEFAGMKKEFSAKPEKITEQWPGELAAFSRQDFVTAIPSPLLVVTGWKANGKENACLQSWAAFCGDGGEFISQELRRRV